MRVRFDYFGKQKEIHFSGVNVFFGFNNSGKSRLSKLLYEGFMQKSKGQFIVNGYQLLKNQYEVIYIDSKESIEEHIKFTTKSLFKKIYFEDIVNALDINDEFSTFINEKFKYVNDKVVLLCKNIFFKDEQVTIKLSLDSIDEMISSCVRIVLTNEFLSSSNSRMLFYNAVFEFASKSSQKKVFIIDDFDLNFDECNTYDLLGKILKDENNTYILFTSKALSLPYIVNKGSIFNIRNNKIIDLTNIEAIIKFVLGSESEKYDYEEYLVSSELMVLDQEILDCMQKFENAQYFNLGRMLTNEAYSISCESSTINISTTSNIEKKFLLFIDEMIKSAK